MWKAYYFRFRFVHGHKFEHANNGDRDSIQHNRLQLKNSRSMLTHLPTYLESV